MQLFINFGVSYILRVYLTMFQKSLLFLIFFHLAFMVGAQKVGLVLSGGGALGYAHIGVLKALEENEIPIDYITGTSAGAGASFTGGCGPHGISREFAGPAVNC